MESERLYFRHWQIKDADRLYELAKDEAVGPIAGWPPHQSVEESRAVIENVFHKKECYAICLKETDEPIGCIELKMKGFTDMTEADDECELGYWLGHSYWNKGYMSEAVKAILKHGFEDLGMKKIWAGYYDGNERSKRVQEKCGFEYQWTTEKVEVPLMKEYRKGHVNLMDEKRYIDLYKDGGEE